MTTITKACSIFFSPTHTSQKVANAVVKGTGIASVSQQNLTVLPVSPIHLTTDTLTVFAAPVYGGHIPSVAVERIKEIKGEQTPAIVMVVYGNRDYEHALEELSELVSQQGFTVVAAATFIGEHSYSNKQYPISAGRPNGNDLQKAEAFGKKVFDKINREGIHSIDVMKIKRPKQSAWSTLRFITKVIRMRRAKRPIQAAPSILDISTCTHCGACSKGCPTQAITIGEEQTTDATRCIRCCACVKVCPQHIRVYETPFSKILSTCYAKEKAPQTLL
jgi:ferredoxin/flavodoxin